MMTPAKIEVRFRDCDMMGHVNNAVYLSYFEQTRMHYLEQLIGRDWNYQEFGILLVKNEVSYLKPVHLNDPVEIYLFLEEVGTKSFTFGYKVMVNNEVTTLGSSKLVCFDFKINKSVPVFPEFIEAFKKLETK